MTGKGSKPRPMSVPKSAFDDSFDRIFGKKEPAVTNNNNKFHISYSDRRVTLKPMEPKDD